MPTSSFGVAMLPKASDHTTWSGQLSRIPYKHLEIFSKKKYKNEKVLGVVFPFDALSVREVKTFNNNNNNNFNENNAEKKRAHFDQFPKPERTGLLEYYVPAGYV